mmetsp:Transcript_7174/g.17485  ORF Transcript_7174/g.17485 Transcript_7174/m.17485 type:complete len:242 (-) Transcript_7174:111-836(-)
MASCIKRIQSFLLPTSLPLLPPFYDPFLPDCCRRWHFIFGFAEGAAALGIAPSDVAAAADTLKTIPRPYYSDIGVDSQRIDAITSAHCRHGLAQMFFKIADAAGRYSTEETKNTVVDGFDLIIPFALSSCLKALLSYSLDVFHRLLDVSPGVSQLFQKVESLERRMSERKHMVSRFRLVCDRAVFGFFKILDRIAKFCLVVIPIQRNRRTSLHRWIVSQTNFVFSEIYIRKLNSISHGQFV